MRHRLVSILLLCFCSALPNLARCQAPEYDFALPQGFLEQLRQQPTLETKLKVVGGPHASAFWGPVRPSPSKAPVGRRAHRVGALTVH